MSSFKSNNNPQFRNKFSEDIFKYKYAHDGCETWSDLASTLVKDVCGSLRAGEQNLMTMDEQDAGWLQGANDLMEALRIDIEYLDKYNELDDEAAKNL